LLVTVNNTLKFEIEIVHDLSCHPIVEEYVRVLELSILAYAGTLEAPAKERQITLTTQADYAPASFVTYDAGDGAFTVAACEMKYPPT